MAYTITDTMASCRHSRADVLDAGESGFLSEYFCELRSHVNKQPCACVIRNQAYCRVYQRWTDHESIILN